MNNFLIASTDMSIQLKMMFCSFLFVSLFASYKIVPFEREYEKKMKRKEKTALRQRVLNYRRFAQSLNRPHSWIFHQQLSPKAVFDIHLYSMDVPLTHIRRSK